jgi:hypothetical protein
MHWIQVARNFCLSVGDLVRKVSVTFVIHVRKSKQLDEKHRNKERNKIGKEKMYNVNILGIIQNLMERKNTKET